MPHKSAPLERPINGFAQKWFDDMEETARTIRENEIGVYVAL